MFVGAAYIVVNPFGDTPEPVVKTPDKDLQLSFSFLFSGPCTPTKTLKKLPISLLSSRVLYRNSVAPRVE